MSRTVLQGPPTRAKWTQNSLPANNPSHQIVPVSDPSSSSMSSTSNAASGPGDVVVHVVARTDVGRTREHNEDAFAVADLSIEASETEADSFTHPAGPRGALFMVADGMGGAAAGEIASEMAVQIVIGEMRSSWLMSEANDP